MPAPFYSPTAFLRWPSALAIIVTRAGTPAVTNGRKGKNKIFFACRDHEHAEEVVRKIREAKAGTEILL